MSFLPEIPKSWVMLSLCFMDVILIAICVVNASCGDVTLNALIAILGAGAGYLLKEAKE